MRFGSLRMAVKANAAVSGQGAVKHLSACLRAGEAGQQGVSIVIQHRGMQARVVDPLD
ncbi:hypothetical protein D3C81_1624200 [compost metagenome]